MSTVSIPPGWYPDPAGAQQWRLWNGTTWTSMVRAYESPPPAQAVADLSTMRITRLLQRYGILVAFSGVGLLSAAFNSEHAPLWFAHLVWWAGAVFTLIGSFFYAFSARQLRGHWYIVDVIPVLNIISWTALSQRRLSGISGAVSTRLVQLTLLLAVVVSASVLEVIPLSFLAVVHWRYASMLLDENPMS